jgi:alpha-tubulin suppressor-like RCC1 family protein
MDSSGLTFAQISVGEFHTCGLIESGAAYCWGQNYRGQLGDGTFTDSGVPTAVTGGMMFRQIRAGAGHTCAIDDARGETYCWGLNSNYQLGWGPGPDVPYPQQMWGGYRYKQVSAGLYHTCGTDTGDRYETFCWGDNSSGQLGVGTMMTITMPVSTAAGLGLTRIAAGGAHTCGLTASGAADCWGANSEGQLGNPEWEIATSPVAVLGGLEFEQITTGLNHTCALTSAGAAYCWGWNYYGQLGDGTRTNRRTPTAVSGELIF